MTRQMIDRAYAEDGLGVASWMAARGERALASQLSEYLQGELVKISAARRPARTCGRHGRRSTVPA